MPEDPNLEIETDKPEPEGKPAEPNQPTPPAIDYEKKFAESTKEAQLLAERNKALEAQLAERNQTKEPTDSELRTAFPSWDLMSDTEKDLARRTIAAERTAGNAVSSLDEIKAERSWNTSIELELAKNNALQGKEQAFRQYASRPQYKNIPMEVLVSAFLQTQTPAAPAPAPTPKPGLEPGNGGPRTPDKPKTLSADELTALRTSNYKAYQDYVKTHDIEIDI